MAESPGSSTSAKSLKFSRKELIATLFLITALLIGIGIKYSVDYHWWLPETKVVDPDPESIRLKINLNRAEWYEFIILPGIGEKKARAIVEYRKSKGAFRTIEQLYEVNGIGKKTVNKIKDLVFIDNPLQSKKTKNG
ncbi:MAG: helix-hairpin-helix domain-containing protein [Candidatus Scalinduaceae bacterium]